MDFSSIKDNGLEELISGWEISSDKNTIFDERGNSYNIQDIVEKDENYVKVILEDGSKGFVFRNDIYLWKKTSKEDVIERIDGKFAIYYNGKVSGVYDEINELKIENGKIYGIVREKEKWKVVILNEELNELAKSDGYDWIGELKIENERIYVTVEEKMVKWRYIIFDNDLNELAKSDKYDEILSWKIENGEIYGKVEKYGGQVLIIGNENGFIDSGTRYDRICGWEIYNENICACVKGIYGGDKLIIFDKNLNELYIKGYDWIYSWEIKNNGTIHAEVKENGKYINVWLNRELKEVYKSKVKMIEI